MDYSPTKRLEEIARKYPGAWRLIDVFRDGRGKDLPLWPQWCFLPFAAWYAIASDHHGGVVPIGAGADIGRLAALGTWRYSQGIYRFDEDIFAAVWDTDITGDLPADALQRLPEWCVYIDFPEKHRSTTGFLGFWAHLEWDVKSHEAELRLLLNSPTGINPMPIHLGDWSLLSGIEKTISESKKHLPVDINIPRQTIREMADQLMPMVSLLLYLCSDQPDYNTEKRPRRPHPKKTKKTTRLFPATGPTIWTLGEEIGSMIRQAGVSPGTGKRRPHLRRAHWHGFWTGPRAGNRKFIHKWLAPIIVGGEDEKENNDA